MGKIREKTGIFGGTFDPIHIGHLMLAETARERLSLEKILFMPTPSPYHRTDKSVLCLEHRVNMVRLAIKENERFELSDFEIKRPGDTYTADTVRAFKETYPETEIYLIVGGDSLFSMESWKDAADIFKMAHIVTSMRKGEGRGASGSCAACGPARGKSEGEKEDLPEETREEEAGSFESKVRYLKRKYKAEITDVEMPVMEISSNDIADRIRRGRSIRYLVPEAVREYIESNGLYRE